MAPRVVRGSAVDEEGEKDDAAEGLQAGESRGRILVQAQGGERQLRHSSAVRGLRWVLGLQGIRPNWYQATIELGWRTKLARAPLPRCHRRRRRRRRCGGGGGGCRGVGRRQRPRGRGKHGRAADVLLGCRQQVHLWHRRQRSPLLHRGCGRTFARRLDNHPGSGTHHREVEVQGDVRVHLRNVRQEGFVERLIGFVLAFFFLPGAALRQ
mmetsp:Transcript_95646/g.309837  ORF Transcript_95646/g.309837 Transcript_95646/m.309837 type:complete len:210 (+) Transcript_95646:1456-2085(+)